MPTTLKDIPDTRNLLPMYMIKIWWSPDGTPWSSYRLACAYAEDNSLPLEGIKEENAFMPTNEYEESSRVYSPSRGTFYELGVQYDRPDRTERLRASGLAKLTADEKEALGLSSAR